MGGQSQYQNNQGDGQQRQKFKGRQFVPVNLKMIDDGGATDDAIEIDGESVQNVSKLIYIILYKIYRSLLLLELSSNIKKT
jgi:hypothetical protein